MKVEIQEKDKAYRARNLIIAGVANMVGLVARASPELERAEDPRSKNVRIFMDRSKK